MKDVTQWAVTQNQTGCWVSPVWSPALWKVPVIAAKLGTGEIYTFHLCSFQRFTCSRTSGRFRLCEHFYRVCPQIWRKGRFSCRSRPTAHYSFAFFKNWNVIIASSLLLLLHIRTCLALLTCWDQQIHHIPVNFLGLISCVSYICSLIRRFMTVWVLFYSHSKCQQTSDDRNQVCVDVFPHQTV